MGLPLRQAAKIGAYVVKKHLSGGRRYPLVLMLEPLFRCNLACAGCGKIDYPDEILNQRLSVAAMHGGDRRMRRAGRLHRRRRAAAASRHGRRSSKAIIARDKFVDPVHQRAAAGQEDRPVQAASRISPGRSISTATRRCTTSRCARTASTTSAVAAIKLAKSKGFRTQINCTLFDGADPERDRRLLRRHDGDGRGRHHRLARLCL